MEMILNVKLTVEQYSTIKTALRLELERQPNRDCEVSKMILSALNAVNNASVVKN